MASHVVVPDPADYTDPEMTVHVTYNPTFAELQKLSADEEVTTE